MHISFDHKLFLEVKPQNLRQFYDLVMKKPLPSIAERGELFEYLGLGPADDFIGTAGQNQAIIEMLYLLAEQEELP